VPEHNKIQLNVMIDEMAETEISEFKNSGSFRGLF